MVIEIFWVLGWCFQKGKKQDLTLFDVEKGKKQDLTLFGVVMKRFLCICFFIAGGNLHAASFDCSARLNSIEKIICEEPSISVLDERLSDSYRLVKKVIQEPDILRNSQRNWLKKQRNSCDSVKCLQKAYQSRIADLHKTYKLVLASEAWQTRSHFQINFSLNDPLCQEYLDVLNQTPEVKVCQIPSLQGTSITPVVFSPLTGEHLKETDKIVYEQNGGGPWDDWEEQWPERKKKYEMGYLKLGEAYWDLDQDGKLDRIVKRSMPSSMCEPLDVGRVGDVRRELRKNWSTKPITEQLKVANSVGYKSYFSLIRDGRLNFVEGQHLATYQGSYMSIDHRKTNFINGTNNWGSTEWIVIWQMNPVKLKNSRSFRASPAICKFEFIY